MLKLLIPRSLANLVGTFDVWVTVIALIGLQGATGAHFVDTRVFTPGTFSLSFFAPAAPP